MWAWDTDGIDSNGNLYIYWWTLDIEARSPTDYDGVVVFEWWKLIIDGEEYDTVPNQMMWWRWWNMQWIVVCLCRRVGQTKKTCPKQGILGREDLCGHGKSAVWGCIPETLQIRCR